MPLITTGEVKGGWLKIINVGDCCLNDYGKNLFRDGDKIKIILGKPDDNINEEDLND